MAPSTFPNGDVEVEHTTRDPSRGRRRHYGRSKLDVNTAVGQASWISSVINLLNTMVGAGCLAMPLAMSHMGILLGSIVILWGGLVAGFGLYLQTRCAQYLERGSSSFFALSQITYPNAAVIFDAAIMIKCFGVGVSYLIIIGQLMPGVVLGFVDEDTVVPFLVDRHFWVTAFMLIVIPLSFLRRLDSLKYTSFVALVSMAYLVVLVVYHYAAGDTFPSSGPKYQTPIRVFKWAGPIPTLSSFPLITFAYTCHQNLFPIINEIGNNSHFRTTAVILCSTGSAAAIYLTVALAGYLSFGNEVSGNIVSQYAPSVSSTIGRAAIVVLVMFSYPLMIHPCRASCDAVLKWRPKGKGAKSSQVSSASGSTLEGSPERDTPLLHKGRKRFDEMGELRFATLTTVILILSYIVAMTVSSLEAVLAYVGSTGSTAISFILPGLFYYKISAPDSTLHQELLKQEDDFDADEEEDEGTGANENDNLLSRTLSNSGFLSISGRSLMKKTRNFRRATLRRLSLALAIYGVVVMVLCLVVNTFFIVSH